MALRSRNPAYPRVSDNVVPKIETKFYGMLSGEPASELPDGYSALNYNVIDRGEYYDVRNGSRRYTSFKIGFEITTVNTTSDTLTLASVHQWSTGDCIYLKGDGLPPPFAIETPYYIIKVDSKNIKLAASYANAIAGTQVNVTGDKTGTCYVYYGEINGFYDHTGLKVVVFVFGNSVYIANKKLNIFTKVLNLHNEDPKGVTSLWGRDNDVFLFSTTGIFKIVLDGTFYWMDKVNKSNPSVLITDINETVSLTFGYLYIYSIARISGTGNRDRLGSDKVEFESGTCLNQSIVKDYGEVFFGTAIGVTLTDLHSVGTLTVPNDTFGITHFPLYRTKNIGENSGGAGTSIESVGNRRDYLVWIADVPVAKAFVIDTSTSPGNGILVSGNKFVYGDATCTLKDTAGNTATISAYTDTDHVTLGAGLASGVAIYCAIGGGRVMRCSQAGYVVTRDLGDTYATTDKGLYIFLSDGSKRTIVRYLTANTVQVAEAGDFSNYAGTLKPLVGNFSRKWNDTVPDAPQGNGRISWKDIAERNYIYNVPRRFFEPIPNCDIGIVENGFMVCALRRSSKYYYSQIGDKEYHAGYYFNPTQTRKINGSINQLVVFPSKVIILTDKTTIELLLTNSTNTGNSEVGELISELSQPDTIDTQRGVKAWQTIRFKNATTMLALCSDYSYRVFNGVSWGEDLSIISGKDAVSKKYLKLADQYYGITSFYSNFAGAKMWFRKWSDLSNTSGYTYEAVQYALDDEDESEQFDLIPFADRGSGDGDVQHILI